MREQGELPVEEGAGAEAADGGGHAVAAHEVEAGLGAGVFGRVLDGVERRGGEVQAVETLAVEGLEVGPGCEDLGVRGGLAELDADALGVAVDYGYAVAVRGEGEGRGVEAAGAEAVPRSLATSSWSFSSSFLMWGMTLPRMSSEATPG